MMFFGRAVKIRCALGLLVAFGDLIEFLLPGENQYSISQLGFDSGSRGIY